jgi:hypothetical protein
MLRDSASRAPQAEGFNTARIFRLLSLNPDPRKPNSGLRASSPEIGAASESAEALRQHNFNL